MVLEGTPGENIVIARKSGDTWYIGGMSLDARQYTLKTDFLDNAGYQAIIWSDVPDSDKYPRKLARKESQVNRNSGISISVVAGGGFVAKLEKNTNN